VDYEILYTPKEMVEDIWPKVQGYIDSALEYSIGEYLHTDILELIMSGQMQLWCVGDGNEIIAAYTTQIRNYPQLNTLLVHTLGGSNFHKWGRLMEESLYQLARLQNCSHLEVYGRKGWGRLLGREANFKQQYVVLTKEIPREDPH
jgi:hypothetical protein